jgi:hypothetical protein
VKEKIPLLDRLLPVDGRLPLDVLLIALLSAAAFTGPFATYVLNRRTYDFLGSYFLSGISVANNTVQINPVPMIFFFGLFILLAVAAAILSFRGRPHLGAWLTVLAGVLTMGWAVLTNTQLVNILDGLRTVNTGWGLNMLAVCGVLLIVRGMYSLRRLGTLCTLDFMAMPVGLYLLINNYFPMVGLFITFKNIDYRVGILNSPWCGFDNFSYLFATSDAWLITKNTLTYNFGFIVIGNLLGILIGLFLANL